MTIRTVDEYQKKENRLKEIKEILEKIAKMDDIDLARVIALREEGKILAEEMKEYINTLFVKQ